MEQFLRMKKRYLKLLNSSSTIARQPLIFRKHSSVTILTLTTGCSANLAVFPCIYTYLDRFLNVTNQAVAEQDDSTDLVFS
jgi:hypothetical protein